MIYLSVVFLLLILSFRYDINGKTKYRDQCYLAVLLVFVLISGLRWRIGIDTTNYLYHFYHDYPYLSDFSFKDYSFGKDPFFVLLNSIVKSLGGRFYIVQLIHAAFVNGLIFRYIRKHCPYIFTCLFFYSIISYLPYNTEILRGSMSIVICLYANDYFLDKKWLKGYSLLLIASMFHAQTIVMFIMPLLLFVKFNFKGILILIGAFVTGQVTGMLITDYITEMLGNEVIARKAMLYGDTNDSSMMGGVSFLVYVIIPFTYILLSIRHMKKSEEQNKMQILEPLVFFYFIFYMVQLGFKMAYRYMDYYMIYLVFFYTYGFVSLAKSITLKSGLSFVRAFVIFFPVIWLYSQIYVLKKYNIQQKYLPYSSIFDKKVSKDRENLYYEYYNYQEY